MKMKCIVAFTVFLHLCNLQAFAVVVSPENSPAAIVVGENVTLKANPPATIVAGVWNIDSTQIVFWYPDTTIITQKYINRTSVDSNHGSITITFLQVEDSGVYVLNGAKPTFQRRLTLSVQVPISNVTMTVTNTNLIEFNDSVTLNCSASGTPLQFEWINRTSVLVPNNRIQISNNDKYSILTIREVTRFDTGPFFCNVSNNVSYDRSWSVSLNISYGPSNLTLEVAPDKKVYISGSNITLTCSADSEPAASYMWFFNETALNKFGHHLELTNSKMTESGIYMCLVHNRVTNRYEKKSRSLYILDPISAVSIHQTESFPIQNMNFTLSCEVTGPVETIYWMKSSSALLTDNRISISNKNKTLNFTPVDNSDNGDYQCMAINAVSNKSDEYKLRVNYGPYNVSISGPSVLATGSNVTLSCDASSWPPSSISWFFNGSIVGMYEMYSLSPAKSGEYNCTAHNNITGLSSSATKMLTVIDLISKVEVIKVDGPPILNKTFTLSCNVTGPADYIHWMKNGSYLHYNDRISFSDKNKTLTFTPVEHSDNGTYQCTAMNAVSKLSSSEYMLMVNYGPWNTVIYSEPVVKLGSNTRLHCSANSRPPSVYSWYFKNSMIGEGDWIELTNLTLLNSGEYTCKAHNNVTGMNSSATTNLRVIAPLTEVIVVANSQTPILGKSFQLNCSANSETTFIYWLMNGMHLGWNSMESLSFSEGNVSMTIGSLTHGDNGDYQCEAHNAISNKTSPMYELKVNFGPNNVSISGPKLAETGDIVMFNCSASSWPSSHFSWYFTSGSTQMVELAANGSSYTTKPLTLESSGNYICMANNNVTGLNSSASIKLMVFETITSVVVKPSPVIPMDSVDFSLYCNVTGQSNSVHWVRNSRPLVLSSTMSISNHNTTLSFKPLKIANDGKYQCIAENAVRMHTSEPYSLLVNHGPRKVVISLATENPFTLTCSAPSQPPSTYVWVLDGQIVGNSSDIMLNIIQVVKLENITCIAKNPLTSVSLTATFQIPDLDAAPPLQSRVDLVLVVLLALSLCLFGNNIY